MKSKEIIVCMDACRDEKNMGKLNQGHKFFGKMFSSLAAAVLTSAFFVSVPLTGMGAVDSSGGTGNTSHAFDSDIYSWVVSGYKNDAEGVYSAIVGGSENYTTGKNSVVLGGAHIISGGEDSLSGGGCFGAATGAYTTRLGGFDGIVQGQYSTGIGGGSTGEKAYGTLALGQGAVVTNGGVDGTSEYSYTHSSVALGYEATADEAGTIAVGHDAGDASGWDVVYQYDENGKIKTDVDPVIKARDPYKESYYNRIVKMADGINAHDAVTMGQLVKYTNDRAMVDASNIGNNLQVADGTDDATGLLKLRGASDDEKQINLDAWGAALGTGTAASGNSQLITGGTLYKEVRPAGGNYIKKDQTTAVNLSALDTQVKTNENGISSLDKRMGSLSSDGSYIYASGSIYSNLSSLDTHVKANGDAIAVNKNDIATHSGKIASLETSAASQAVRISSLSTTVESHTTSITDLKETVKTQGNQISALESKMDAKTGELDTKISGLDGRIKTSEEKISSLETTVNENKNTISQNSKAIQDLQQSGEALKKDNEAIHQTLNENRAKISENAGKIDGNTAAIAANQSAISKNEKAIQDMQAKNGALEQKLDSRVNTDLSNLSDKGRENFRKEVENAVGTLSGDGKIEKENKGLLTGDTVYQEVHVDGGTYISSKNTVGQNLSALDEAVKNTSGLIHSDGKTIHIGETSDASKIDVRGKEGKGRIITGVVTDASDMTSAANVLYVNEMASAGRESIYEDMNRMYSRLDSSINKGVAGSSALAALSPMELDGDEKISFAAGYGHYRNANAAALGAFYSPNANTRFSFGISLGNGDAAMNAGLSFKLGKGSSYAGVSKADMVRTIQSQAEKIDRLEKENQEMKKAIEEILKKLG